MCSSPETALSLLAMSDPRISSIAEALDGAPEDLVERSAAARAQAQGISVDEVLSAWAGGEGVAAPPPSAPSADAAPAPPAPSSEPAPEAETPPAPMAGPVAVAASIVEQEVEQVDEDEAHVEPARLSDRLRIGAKVGALIGGLLGIIGVLVATPMMLSRLTLASGEITPAVEVEPLEAVLAIAALSAVFAAIVTLVSRGAAGIVSPAFETESSPRGSSVLGVLMGLVLGVIAGGILVGMAEETATATKLLPIRSLIFAVVLGGVVLGGITGAVAQGLAQPARLRGEAAVEAAVVQRRLVDSMMIPSGAALIIVVIVISLGSLLVRYPSYASVLAIMVALGVLGFASLMSSRPNLRVSRGEVLVAATGVGVVLLMLALVAAQTSGGGH